jgi:hypothetical protein
VRAILQEVLVTNQGYELPRAAPAEVGSKPSRREVAAPKERT